jgi:DNA replication protein DnaD
MKIHAIGNKKQKRAASITLEAENEIEEAVLFQKFGELVENPPKLELWFAEVLRAVKDKPINVQEIGEGLDVSSTAMNNRVARLFNMGLLHRKKEAVAEGGSRYLYWLNLRREGDAKPCDVLEGDDL